MFRKAKITKIGKIERIGQNKYNLIGGWYFIDDPTGEPYNPLDNDLIIGGYSGEELIKLSTDIRTRINLFRYK